MFGRNFKPRGKHSTHTTFSGVARLCYYHAMTWQHPNSPQLLEHKCWYHFLAPRYWGLWVALGLLRLCVLLPMPVIRAIGFWLGG